MRNILVLGAGQSAGFLVQQLLAEAEAHDWFVTVGDRDERLARELVGDHARGAAVSFDVGDAEMTASQVERSAVVVNMLPQRFQPSLAWACLHHGRHMVSVSYLDREMSEMETEAHRKGILFLTEVGLDPGIDIMSAMQAIHRIQDAGGVITSFESYGSGVPAPEDAPNPLGYCITWNPRNVAMAGESGAQYLREGRIKIRPWHKLFRHHWPKVVPGIGPMEAYPNRDSLSYRERLGLDNVETLIRGTLRHPGWCDTWAAVVDLGLPNETLAVPSLERRSWAEIVEMFLPDRASGEMLEDRVARYLGLEPTGQVMENLRWLGLFGTEPAGIDGTTAADAVIHLLRTRLPLPVSARDMVILLHDLEAVYPEEGGRREQLRSYFVHRGDPGGFTAMSKTVGWPAAIAVRLLMTGQLPLTGCRVPTHPALYGPILAELEMAGLRFTELAGPVEAMEGGVTC